MATIYSTAVFHDLVAVTSIPPTIYTVPSGFVFVLRDIELYQDQRFGIPGAVVRFAEGVADRWFLAFGMPVTAFSWRQWEGRQAFAAGSELQACSDASAVTARVSGYLLAA